MGPVQPLRAHRFRRANSANTRPSMRPPATSTRGFMPLVSDGADAVSATAAAFGATSLAPRARCRYGAARCRLLWCSAGCSKTCVFAAEVADRSAMGLDPSSRGLALEAMDMSSAVPVAAHARTQEPAKPASVRVSASAGTCLSCILQWRLTRSKRALMQEQLEAEFWFEAMQSKYKVMPGLEHYTCVIAAMTRVVRLEDADSIGSTMPCKPDAAAWRTLLTGCVVHCKVDMPVVMGQRLLEIDPNDGSSYVMLANVYSAAGRKDGVPEAGTAMRDRGVRIQKRRRSKLD
ncbi:hypothetical protein ACQ4PT_010174 [Festuca glaucescens]